jgi:hypothetical protein
MGYPGDQSQSGGWPPEQPSQSPSPYDTGQGSSASRYGPSPFSPPPAGPPPADEERPDSGAGAPSYGSDGSSGYSTGPTADSTANPYQPEGPGGPGDPYGGPGPYGGPSAGTYEASHDPGYGANYNAGYSTDNTDYNADYNSNYNADQGVSYDPHDPNRGGPMPPERSKLPLIIGGIVGAVVLVGGGIMAVSLLGGDSGKKTVAGTAPPAAASPPGTGASNAPTTAAPKPTTTTGPLGAKLKSRSSDPNPLTLGEVFKHHKFGRYVMAAQRRDGNCGKVVHGARFAAALKSGGCTQLLRATFRTTDGKLIGTVGVANLKTETAARKVQQAGAGKDAWMLPLPGSGTTKKIGKGSALGTAETRGHYVLLSWVQRPDGKELTAGQRGTVSTFVARVILGSNLTTALQYRGISGKPYGT